MSSISSENPSSEGPSSTLVDADEDTDESTLYLQTIFQESTTDSQKLDPQRYKVLKYDEKKKNGVRDIIKEIDHIIEQQQSSSVFAGDIVIIIYDGIIIEEDIFKHLEELDVRFTSLSGPGNCVILTMALAPHEGCAIFFSLPSNAMRDQIQRRMRSGIKRNLEVNIQRKILDTLNSWMRVSFEGSQQTQPRPLQMLLNELRHALTVEIQTTLPDIPVPSTSTLDCLLSTWLNLHQDLLPRFSTLLHGQTQRQLNLLNQLQQQLQLPNAPQDDLEDLIAQQIDPVELIVPSGSFKVDTFVHSAQEICNRVFRGADLDRATQKNWNAGIHGSKIPDYSIAPHYLYFVHSAQHRPFVPPVMVEVGLTDDRVKVWFDCIFTILGTRFQVDAMYGVELHANRATRTLESIDIYHFDVSLGALYGIVNDLPRRGREQASVSLVVKYKALQKLYDLRALERLRQWEKNGHSEDGYREVLDQIKGLRCRYLLPYEPVTTDDQERTTMPSALRTLQSYQRYGDETLREEMTDYNEILTQCQNIVDRYIAREGAGTDSEQLAREGEVMLVQKIFERKSLTRVDEHCTESMQFPIKAFTGLDLLSKEFISLSPRQLQDCFSQAAMLFREPSVDNVELSLPIQKKMIRGFREVASLNYPDYPPKEAKAKLKRAFKKSEDGFVWLRVKTRHVNVRAQLRFWLIQPERTEHGNRILFIHECSKRHPYGPPIDRSLESSQDPDRNIDQGEQERDDSDSNEPESSTAVRVRRSSQKPPKRGHSSSPSNERDEGRTLTRTLKSGAETFRRKVRKQSGTSKAKYTPSAAQEELPEEVSQCLNRLSNSKKAQVIPYLMASLHDIEWTPAYLRAFETFLSKNTYYIQEILALPGHLKATLDVLVRNAQTQGPQNSQSPDSENIEHEGSGQAD